VCGLMNMQYAIEDGKVYVLEANPRASRTVPLVSKVCNISMVPLATEIITAEFTGKESPLKNLKEKSIPHYGVKEAVFPFNMFPEVDPLLGPEIRSTGEVLGLADTVGEAYFKAHEGTKSKLPLSGTVLISVSNKDKGEAVDVAKRFAQAGFHILATGHTQELLTQSGVAAEKIFKMTEGRPDVYDAITNGKVDLVVNTPKGDEAGPDDSYVRKACIKSRVPYITTMAAALASADGILTVQKQKTKDVVSLQELHSHIH
ncbi:MAG: carbamoyl phosphate synthase large subunit, partial [Clostridia bacterium]|nr:carbamoyl phosphate synthase large subunit [Clostridia bacterium]